MITSRTSYFLKFWFAVNDWVTEAGEMKHGKLLSHIECSKLKIKQRSWMKIQIWWRCEFLSMYLEML
jgi:hypothetical protein